MNKPLSAASVMAVPNLLHRSPAVMMRRHSVLLVDPNGPKHRSFGEFAGGATAECTAVVCCLPCAAVELAVLAVYKVPAGLCKKAWKKNKRVRLARKRRQGSGVMEYQLGLAAYDAASDMVVLRHDMDGEEMVLHDFDPEVHMVDSDVWEKMYVTGFWRSADDSDDSDSDSDDDDHEDDDNTKALLC